MVVGVKSGFKPGRLVPSIQSQIAKTFHFGANRSFGWRTLCSIARLAQSAERKALNLVVVGSSPTVGVLIGACKLSCRSHVVLNAQLDERCTFTEPFHCMPGVGRHLPGRFHITGNFGGRYALGGQGAVCSGRLSGFLTGGMF